MIDIGAIVVCRQTGAQLWVVNGPAPRGYWYLRGVRVDERGRKSYEGRVAGAGDITVITEAPTYAAGAAVKHNGARHTVAADNGDHVELVVPESVVPRRGGGALRLAAGNTTTVAKADLVLDDMF